MTNTDINRSVGSGRFEYGQHDVSIDVRITRQYMLGNVMNGRSGTAYYRVVIVRAEHDDEVEVKNTAWVNIEVSRQLSPTDVIRILFGIDDKESLLAQKPNPVPDLEHQIEVTVRPVLEKLDEMYEYLDVEYDIDIEIGMERVKHEVSWIEVEDEIDRISTELAQ